MKSFSHGNNLQVQVAAWWESRQEHLGRYIQDRNLHLFKGTN